LGIRTDKILNMKNLLTLMRPHQYVKNLFIFLPLFFAGQITTPVLVLNAFMAFIAFSLSASAIYILNDYHDIAEDQLHPKKKYRPLASGAISKKTALYLMALLITAGFYLIYTLSINATIILGLYIALNIAYSFYLKHVAILDICIIAIGFVLRLFVGATVTSITLSMWIVIMTFLLALFLALAKRRDDVLLYMDTGKKMRKVIDGYNIQFIDSAMAIMASVVIVAYIIYTTSSEVVQRLNTQYLYLTALFVIIGVMRYLQISFVKQDSGSPTKIILKDIFIQLTLLFWVMSFAWILYS